MLEAFTHRKSRKVHPNSLVEDEITSTFFGPFRFMTPKDVWHIVGRLGLWNLSEEHEEPTAHSVQFWREFRKQAIRSQPDVVFSFTMPDGSIRVLIVEVKWAASASSKDEQGVPDQLARQWVAVLTEMGTPHCTQHIYLTRFRSEAEQGIEKTMDCRVVGFSPKKWRTRAKGITWSDLSLRLPMLTGASSAVANWASSQSEFLRLLNVRPFEGFQVVRAFAVSTLPFVLRGSGLHWPDLRGISIQKLGPFNR